MYLSILLINCIFQWFFVLGKVKLYLSIVSFANLFVNFAILRNSKINWKICLWESFKWYTYLKLDNFLAHFFAYHFLTFFRKFGKLDGSHGRHLLAVKTGNVMSYFVFVTVYLLLYTVYLWNFNFLWVRDGYSKSNEKFFERYGDLRKRTST